MTIGASWLHPLLDADAVNAAKAAAVAQLGSLMDAGQISDPRFAELMGIVNEPAGVVLHKSTQGKLPL